MKVNCGNDICIFNIDNECIKEEITIKENVNAEYGLCANACAVSKDELNKIVKYHSRDIISRIKEEIAQEKFKAENLQKQIEENNNQIEELHKDKVDRTSEILREARKTAHPYKSGKGKNLKDSYSSSELEDMYVVQGLSLMAISNITDVPKSTLYERLKRIGAVDRKKKSMEATFDMTETEIDM